VTRAVVQYDDKPCADTAPFCKKDGTGKCNAKDGTCSVRFELLRSVRRCSIAIHLCVVHELRLHAEAACGRASVCMA
jgi:hypothetical protein